jgi:hypothetical protein
VDLKINDVFGTENKLKNLMKNSTTNSCGLQCYNFHRIFLIHFILWQIEKLNIILIIKQPIYRGSGGARLLKSL